MSVNMSEQYAQETGQDNTSCYATSRTTMFLGKVKRIHSRFIWFYIRENKPHKLQQGGKCSCSGLTRQYSAILTLLILKGRPSDRKEIKMFSLRVFFFFYNIEIQQCGITHFKFDQHKFKLRVCMLAL